MGKQIKKGKAKAFDDPPQAPPQPQPSLTQVKLRDGLNRLEEVPEDTEPDDHGKGHYLHAVRFMYYHLSTYFLPFPIYHPWMIFIRMNEC